MTTYEAGTPGEPSVVAPVQPAPPSPEQVQAELRKADIAETMGLWEDAHRAGIAEGREEMLDRLQPYLQHIGNCGAAGSDPEDSRCICGLRRTWAGL